MREQNHYTPKFGREDDNWDESVWQTGSTEPPKNRGGLFALMLILIIFLCGIITVLGVLNIKLFRELNVQKKNELSISFTVTETEPTKEVLISETVPVAAQAEESVSLKLEEARKSLDNIPAEGAMSLQDIYVQNIPSVTSITSVSGSGSSTGTGVVLSQDGYIVTNAHVVAGGQSISVQLTDDREFPAEIVGTDEITDLAVLYIDTDDLVPAQFGDSEVLRVGDTVVAIGDPLGVEFRGTYTDGIVSAINRNVSIDGRNMTLIQTNAALNSGNSGGPLINCYGQVIGINTMKIGTFTNRSGVEGIGFAIPSTTVKDVVEQLIHQGYVSGRPDIGLKGDALSSFYQYYYRLPAGLYITGVDHGCDAHRKGIEQGDILLSIDDNRITSMDELKTYLYNCEVGQNVEVIVYRQGQQYKLNLTLHEDKG